MRSSSGLFALLAAGLLLAAWGGQHLFALTSVESRLVVLGRADGGEASALEDDLLLAADADTPLDLGGLSQAQQQSTPDESGAAAGLGGSLKWAHNRPSQQRRVIGAIGRRQQARQLQHTTGAHSWRDAKSPHSDNATRAARRFAWHWPYPNGRPAEKRSLTSSSSSPMQPGDGEPPPTDGRRHRNHDDQFIYVVSPISDLVHSFQAERFAQGYKNLLPMFSDGYKVGLQKVVSPAGRQFAGEPPPHLAPGQVGPEPIGCHASRTLVQLTKDQLDPLTGQPVRRCTGSVELNACEGSCASSVQPSIKSPTGFIKVSVQAADPPQWPLLIKLSADC
jgi:hypothetical protein